MHITKFCNSQPFLKLIRLYESLNPEPHIWKFSIFRLIKHSRFFIFQKINNEPPYLRFKIWLMVDLLEAHEATLMNYYTRGIDKTGMENTYVWCSIKLWDLYPWNEFVKQFLTVCFSKIALREPISLYNFKKPDYIDFSIDILGCILRYLKGNFSSRKMLGDIQESERIFFPQWNFHPTGLFPAVCK